MCERFKDDFVEKVVKCMETSLINDLKTHYNITIKLCNFKGTPHCKQFFVTLDRGGKCNKCGSLMCESCKNFKSSLCCITDLCVNCCLTQEDINNAAQIEDDSAFCQLCFSRDLYRIHSNQLNNQIYCLHCHSLNTAMNNHRTFLNGSYLA